MRILIFTMALLVSFPLPADSSVAYLIIKATVVNHDKQPTWICMGRVGTCAHIPADKELVKIRPGKYRFHHLDFDKSLHEGDGTRWFKKSTRYKFEAGNIYFIGEFKFTRKRNNRYEMEVDQDISLLRKACESSPKTFASFPVTVLTGTRKFQISCDVSSNNKI